MELWRRCEGNPMTENPQEQDSYVGQRVRVIRARRGMTQQVLADRVGKSRGAIAKYENGERPIDSRTTLLALARALGVTIGDLTGHPEQEKLDPVTAGFHMFVPEIETALWTHGNVTDERAPRDLAALTAATREANRLRADCEYVTLGPMLAPMLVDGYRLIRELPDDERAWDVFGNIAYGVASALKARGYPALAWTAAAEARRAAEHTGSPAAAAGSAFYRSQILLTRPGALASALAEAEGTADRLSADVRTIGDVEVTGMLRLQASLVTAAMGGDPEPHLAEAADQAARLTEAAPSTSLARNDSFRPPNITLWRMSAALERREPGQALALAPTLAPDALPNKNRHAQYFVEIGRAHAMQRNYRDSLYALLRAEHTAPQHVRNMTHVKELVGHMMRTARRDLTTGELGRLAQRVGVAPA
ncbi:helix-turn-helix domain-containing protein [Nocardia nova]|uniref:helix-turn-helix domain-containing protein n=1 Tax=Nocardia nova TaxID=37330 RepID=UPI0011B0B906|nr:helix-turn-helix transcriptional regulator [Nocardia nova]